MALKNPEQESRKTRLIILFCLMENHLSGYEMQGMLKKWRIEEFLPISAATIYRTLLKMEEEGFLTSKDRKKGKYPTAKIYSITELGLIEYEQLLRQEALFTRTGHAISILIGIGNFLKAADRLKLADSWAVSAQERISCIDQRLEHYGEMPGKPYAEWLLLHHEKAMLKAEIDWLDTYRNSISTA